MQAWTLEELTARGIPFVLLRGSPEERVCAIAESSNVTDALATDHGLPATGY